MPGARTFPHAADARQNGPTLPASLDASVAGSGSVLEHARALPLPRRDTRNHRHFTVRPRQRRIHITGLSDPWLGPLRPASHQTMPL